MKRDKKVDNMSMDPQSILNTNRAQMALETLEEERIDRAAARKQKIVSLFIVLAVVVALALVFVLGTIVSQQQAEQEKKEEEEAARIAALKDPREDTIYITSEEPELLPYRMTWSAISAYYSKENGMYITMNFANGHATAVPVTEISIWLKRGDELVASGRLRNIVDLVVPAAGDVDYTFYLDPSLVKITDLGENEDLMWEFEVTTDVEEESQELAKEKREDSLTVTGEKPQVVEGEITYAVTEAYYTNETGMYVTLTFANGKDTAISMKKVSIKLYSDLEELEEDPLVVADELILEESTPIPANGTVTYTHYIIPESVLITELTEKDVLRWVVEYEAE